jgi:hypothetical protein
LCHCVVTAALLAFARRGCETNLWWKPTQRPAHERRFVLEFEHVRPVKFRWTEIAGFKSGGDKVGSEFMLMIKRGSV